MCLPPESWSVCGSPVIYTREGEKRVWSDWESMKWTGKWWGQSITVRLLPVLGITSDCKTGQLRKVQWRLLREVPQRNYVLGARNSGKRHGWEQLPSECRPPPSSISSTWNTSEMNLHNPHPDLLNQNLWEGQWREHCRNACFTMPSRECRHRLLWRQGTWLPDHFNHPGDW